ncbi:MAG: type II/IV secretion system protein [Candidatus Omnitrophica bacterium]|nr:type II/IV secretion system protein [Candidatus Omnitrophota bacterium]
MSAIINALLKKNLITPDQVTIAQVKRQSLQKPVADLLIEMGYLKEDDYFTVAREVFPRGMVNLDDVIIDAGIIQFIPLKQALHYGIFPVMRLKDVFVLAMSDPSNLMATEELQFTMGLDIKPLLCKKSQIAEYIHKYYQPADNVHTILKDMMGEESVAPCEQAPEEIVDFAQRHDEDAGLIKLVNKIIHDAIEDRASDIHIEPQDKNVRVRYRIDGYLKNIIEIPRDLQKRMAARIKILSKMNIAEHRGVQEGRIKALIEGKKIDLRISLIPTFYGEKIVIRILDARATRFNLDSLGFQPDELVAFKQGISKPQGVVLVTGPTGSGKTTTLYSALQHIKCETKNIVTIEDPIEYLIDGVNQLQLNHIKDVTFANGLKSILRQDPDVLLVGEIRDRETADIAFRASLTGHMVFSTLHTNNAVSSLTRLRDIGLESYLITSSIVMVVAQRLIRLICPYCCQEHIPQEALMDQFRPYFKDFSIERFYHGNGCEYCNFSGFYSRASIFEILKIDENIKRLIYNRAPESAIFKEAVAGGMRPLVESGLMKVAAGLTTLEEIAKTIDVTDHSAPVPLFSMDQMDLV